MVMIRDIPGSTRYFWQASSAAQIALAVLDNDESGTKRKLPQNEVLAMALNEVAYANGEGFFFYLRTRDAKHSDDAVLLPDSRRPHTPGALYPTIVYMPFVWDDDIRKGFADETHRGRYLKCSAIINPPSPETPLYGIQFIGHARAQLYNTPDTASLVLLASRDLYLASTDELKKVTGLWDKPYKPSGPDPDHRMNSPSFLWTIKSQADQARLRDMQPFKIDTTLDLYNAIVQKCEPVVGLYSTFTASTLSDIIPRPSTPEAGVMLGTRRDSTVLVTSAAPPSRRGLVKKRKSRDGADDDSAPLA